MVRWILGSVLGLAGLAALIAVGGYFYLKRPDIPYETLATKYESGASRYVDLDGGLRVHYRDEGKRDGPVLVLLHGFSASLHTWEPWVQRLGDEYRVISLDLPGHGLTRAPAGYQASIEAYRDVVASFAQAQGLTSFALAGSSMGGNIAWEYALAHPEQVSALVLVDASGWPREGDNPDQRPLVFKLLQNPVLGPLLRDLDNTRLVRGGLQASFADQSLVDDAMVDRYVELSRAPGHRDILLQIGAHERNVATAERLVALHMPVLILQGNQDRLVPAEHARQFNAAISGSELVMFENVGHIPQEEVPDASANAVRAFLRRAAAPALAQAAN